MKVCVKCGRKRGTAYMDQAVFRGVMEDEPVDVWKCSSTQSCRAYRKYRKKNG